jgi:uncharacterized membrane protein
MAQSGLSYLPQGPAAQPMASSDGVLARLMDTSFNSFVTPLIIKFLYILGIVLAFIAAVIAVVTALFESFWTFIWALVFAPVWLLVTVLFLRVALEFVIVVFQIAGGEHQTAQNTLRQGSSKRM